MKRLVIRWLRCRRSSVYGDSSIKNDERAFVLFAELLGVIPDTRTGKSEAIARSPIKFDLLSNTFIKGQEALVL